MYLSEPEARRLLAPHQPVFMRWHRDGYKGTHQAIGSSPEQWSAQDARTQGSFTRNLIFKEAQQDETDERKVAREGHLDLIDVFDSDGRLAARIRFRSVRLVTRYLDEGPRPELPPSSDAADEWFGNDHLTRSTQTSLLDIGREPERRPTHLLIGRTQDDVTVEFDRLFVVCYDGRHLAWWYEVDPAGEGGARVTPFAPSELPPTIVPPTIDIRRKENRP